MKKQLLTILLIVFTSALFPQMREIKPEAEEFSPKNEYFFPQHPVLFPDSSQMSEVVLFYENQIENINGMAGEYNQAKILYCIAELSRLSGKNTKAIFILMEAYHSVKSELNRHNLARLQSRLLFNGVRVISGGGDDHFFNVVYEDTGNEGMEQMIHQTIEIFLELEDEINLLAMYRNAFEYYQVTRNYEMAWQYGDKLIHYKNYLAAQQLKRELSTLKDIYQMTQKETEIQLLNNQRKILKEQIKASNRAQWGIIGGVGLLLIFSISLMHRVRIMRRTRDLLEAKAAQYQHEKNRAEQNELYKEQFLANVSHEIRTPMNAILGITNILTRNKHPESQAKYLSAMQESAKNLLVLINDILDLSKLGAGKHELVSAPFNPREIIETIRETLKDKAAEKGLGFNVELDDQVPALLSGDGIVLNNILMNLMNNAVSFTAAGKVGMKCSIRKKKDELISLNFEVSDTGVGIVPEKQEKVLKTFVKVYDSSSIKYEGSGLELAIINQLVELQGGSIRLESEPQKGTTFFLELPYLLTPDSGEAVKMEDAEPEQEIGNVSILLVEDNEFNVMVASTELESAIDDLTLEVAGNGSIALEKLSENHFDLVLMDVQMPVMDGYEATRRIRQMKEEKGRIPIIAMTANVLQQEIQKCMKVGMNDYISKPFDTEELVDKIRKLINNPA